VDDNDTMDLTSLFVAVGRIEEKLNSMSERENRTSDRLDKIENRLTKMEADFARNVRPKTPWWVIAGGLSALLVIGLNAIALLRAVL
jgi:hypothetical protein